MRFAIGQHDGVEVEVGKISTDNIKTNLSYT